MIYVQTKLNVADNSGALKVKCIKVLNNKFIGSIGDLLLVSLKKINPKKKLLKSSLQKGVIVRMRRKLKRNGGYISIDENAIVILNNNLLPMGTRILGPILRELRVYRQYSKIISLATYVL
jgi:large subunit ribosomal protein L14